MEFKPFAIQHLERKIGKKLTHISFDNIMCADINGYTLDDEGWIIGLTVNNVGLSDIKFLEDEDFRFLSHLSLGKNKLCNVKGLERLTELEQLYLNNNKLSEVKGVDRLKKLKYLF